MATRAPGGGRGGKQVREATQASIQAVEEALARSDALRLLAAGLRDPDGPDRPELEADDLLGSLAELGIEVRHAEREAVRSVEPRSVRAAAHRALFGHTIAHGCPPYETEYGGRHVFGQAQDLADIAGFYAAFGLQPAPSGERVDHLTCELEFLSILALKEAAALAMANAEGATVCRDAEASFLLHHLGRWLPALTGRASNRLPGSGLTALLSISARLVATRSSTLAIVPQALGPDDIRPIEDEPDGLAFECGDPDDEPGLEIPR